MLVNACPRSALMAIAILCFLAAAGCFQAGEGNGSDDDGSDGSFPAPRDLQAYCNAETVQIHVDYVVEDGVFQGQATYHCDNALGPYAIFGQVVCGAP